MLLPIISAMHGLEVGHSVSQDHFCPVHNKCTNEWTNACISRQTILIDVCSIGLLHCMQGNHQGKDDDVFGLHKVEKPCKVMRSF